MMLTDRKDIAIWIFERKRRGKHSIDKCGLCLLLMLSGPGGWGEGCQKLHAYVGEAGENCRQIVSHRDFQPTTGFDHGQDRRHLWTRFRTSYMDPVLAPQGDRAHRIFDQVITEL